MTTHEGLNGYIVMYRGKRTEVYAKTTLEAQTLGAAFFKVRKAWQVNTYLAELSDGTVNTQVITS